jgi:hypothetical protein
MLVTYAILIASQALMTIAIMHICSVWLDVVTFWGRVNWKNPESIKYTFQFHPIVIIGGVIGFTGTLWSAIKLATT